VLETAEQLSDVRDRFSAFHFIFRAGVWKPRTRPDSFQGAGEAALGWLQEVKERFGFEVATEVATPEHVEAALKAGIDYLWIGARTSANPIAVQAISHQLSAVSCPPKAVLIKNPVNADAALWLGNIERLERTGIPVLAVHRGCSHQPCWRMAHEVRLARPDIPMLLDPSHMSGDAGKVPELIKKVDELGLDGAMIEVHCHPEQALSDSEQQLTPVLLRNALDPIRPRDGQKELNWLRAEIDELDDTLWQTIAARMDVSRRIGAWKKEHHMPPLQPDRYQTIVERISELANERGLSADFALRLYDMIHEESINQQQ
jgi:chorismate mutase